jgi:hypothetical protein
VTNVRPNALSRHEVVELIAKLRTLLVDDVDLFTLMGLPFGASVEDVHAAYVELRRNLGAKRLAELGIEDRGLVAHSLLAQIEIAFTMLTDRKRRPEYIAELEAKRRRRGP